MTTDAKDLFSHAHGLSGEVREAFLRRECGDNAELRLEVQRLLVQAEKADSFFSGEDGDTVSVEELDATCTEDFEGSYTESEGDEVGPYILRQKIGEGGFGTVWMAEQSVPISRMVALKVVKAGMDTRQVLARFEAERQALAMMDHPNIARVLDAGATSSGRPYFAMELVKGIPITQFCDDQNFGPRERLELFKDVCLAVNHAHQKGVIHRDLKPSNVMVTLAADVPVVKVIDFGIAKATHSKLTEKTLYTRFEQFLGTPVYMSPEQAAMSALDIDTRSDIYSLGVLLYELLAGTPPFDQKSLLSAGYDEMRRIIKEDEPPKPSTRVTRSQAWASAKGTGKKLHVSPTSLKGELDWIVMKAIEKDRTRRYETANAFAQDIRRFLSDEPVAAAAPSVLYKCRKFARRNKLAFGTASAIATALVLGLGIAILSYSRERDARSEAERQRGEATAARDVADRKSEEARKAQKTAEEQTQVAVSLQEAYRQQVYHSDMHLASLAHDAGNAIYLNELLDRHLPKPGDTLDLRGLEWFHWWQAAHAQVAQIPVGRPIRTFDISPDYRHSAAVVWESETWVRSTAEHQPVISKFRGAHCLAFSPDGASLVLGGNPLSVFNTSTWRSRELPVPGGGTMSCLSFCSGQPLMASGGAGGSIVLWDPETWEPVGQPLPEDGRVRSLALTRDGRKLIAALDDSRVVVWDLATRTVARTLSGHAGSVGSVVHSPVDDLFVTGSSDGSVRLWNGEFELLGTYEVAAPVNVLRFSPNGKKLIGGTSDNNSVLVWNVERQPPSLDLIQVLKGHSRRITGLGFLADDGNSFMSVSDDGSSKTWDLAKCEPSLRLGKVSMRRPTWADPSRLAFAGDGKEVLVTGPDGERYSINLDSHDLSAPRDPRGFRTIAIARDEAWRAGVAEDGHLAVWSARQGVVRAKHPTLAADVYPRSVVVFSPGPIVAWKENRTGTQFVWNVNEDTTRSLSDAVAGLPDLSPRGDRLAVYRWDTTLLWDITVDPPVCVWQSPGWGPEYCTVFSPGGDLLASASHNGQIRLFDPASGDVVRRLTGHTGAVQSVKFSRDGSWLVSGGEDRTVRIWDVESGQLLSTFVNPDGPVSSVALSPAEDSIASLTDDGVLRLWTTATLEEVNQRGNDWGDRLNACIGQKRWEEALVIIDEALGNNPESPILHRSRSEILQESGDLVGAFSAVTQASALAPMDVNIHTHRVRLGILTDQLADAADSLQIILKLSPEDEEDWMGAAALLISTGELDEYHPLCKDMLKRFRNPKEQEVAERVAKACLIVPPVDSNLPAAVEAARKSVADPDHWVMPYALMSRGLADYRTGNFQGARDWSQRALEQPVAWHVEANASLVLAMSEWHLGLSSSAQTALERATAILDAKAIEYTGGKLAADWHDWFFSQALLREAEAMVSAKQ